MDKETMVIAWLKRTIRIRLSRGSFARNVAVLAGGTALGQAITVLASPILTRLYTPDDFGVLAVYSSMLGILSVVACWRYEIAIPLPEKDDDAVNLVMLSLGILVLMSLLVGFGVLLLRDPIVRWVNVPALRPYLWLLPVGLLLAGSYQVFNYWAVRRQVFGVIAQTKLRQGTGATATQIGIGVINPSLLGLLLGQVVGQATGMLTLAKIFWSHVKSSWKYVHADELAKLSRQYIRFPLFASWSGVLNALSVQIPILMLSSLFGTTITGFYLIAYRILWTPTQLIVQSTSQVLLSAGVEATRKRDITNLTVSVFKRLLLIGVPCFGLIGFLAQDGATLIFGPNWKEVGLIMQYLTPWIGIVFVVSPLSAFSIVLEKQPQEVFFQSVLLISRVGALLSGWALGSVYTAIGLFSLVSTLCWIGYLVWIFGLVHVPIVKVGIALVLKEIVINFLLFLPMIFTKKFVINYVWLLPGTLVSFFLVAARIIFVSCAKGGSNV